MNGRQGGELGRRAAQNIINRTHRHAPKVFDVLQRYENPDVIAVLFFNSDEVLYISPDIFRAELKRITPDPTTEVLTHVAMAMAEQRAKMEPMDTKQTITITARQLQLDDVIIRERGRSYVVTSVGRTPGGYVRVCLADTFYWEFDNDEQVTVER